MTTAQSNQEAFKIDGTRPCPISLLVYLQRNQQKCNQHFFVLAKCLEIFSLGKCLERQKRALGPIPRKIKVLIKSHCTPETYTVKW